MHLDILRQAAPQRFPVLRWEEIDFHVVIHQALQRQPPGLHTETVTDLFCYNDLAFIAHHVGQCITSSYLVRLHYTKGLKPRQGTYLIRKPFIQRSPIWPWRTRGKTASPQPVLEPVRG